MKEQIKFILDRDAVRGESVMKHLKVFIDKDGGSDGYFTYGYSKMKVFGRVVEVHKKHYLIDRMLPDAVGGNESPPKLVRKSKWKPYQRRGKLARLYHKAVSWIKYRWGLLGVSQY